MTTIEEHQGMSKRLQPWKNGRYVVSHRFLRQAVYLVFCITLYTVLRTIFPPFFTHCTKLLHSCSERSDNRSRVVVMTFYIVHVRSTLASPLRHSDLVTRVFPKASEDAWTTAPR